MTIFDHGPIHQVLVTAVPGDAVTNAALAIQAALREHVASEIFASHVHGALGAQVRGLGEFPAGSAVRPDGHTIVHVSMGDDRFTAFLDQALIGNLVLSYHNVTPSRYFEGWDPCTARLLDEGRRLIGRLRHRTALALADSAYNAQDLIAGGYRNVAVAGLILSAERLLDVVPDPATTQRASDIPGPVLLALGQLYPHKRADFLLHSLVAMRRDVPGAHLVLAGATRLERYRSGIDCLISDLDLAEHVTVTGEMTTEALVAWYRRADMLVSASDHEGFCVPLVEAMWFDVPIVARANAAVPETVGDAALLVPSGAGPASFAIACASLASDPSARAALRAAGAARRQAFSERSTKQIFLDALGGGLR